MSYLIDKLLRYVLSILGGGLVIAFETSLHFFVPCFVAILVDVISAYDLNRRLHQKYPGKCDGKFKSSYKLQILKTMVIVFLVIICANYVDREVLKDDDTGIAVRFVMGIFFFYQIWSILENWSSENDNKIARALQRIMINKVERHLKVSINDILLNDQEIENDKVKQKWEK